MRKIRTPYVNLDMSLFNIYKSYKLGYKNGDYTLSPLNFMLSTRREQSTEAVGFPCQPINIAQL